jgi:CSLREA domain-containing protein
LVNTDVFVMNADGTAQTDITNDAAQDDHPDWQPVFTPPSIFTVNSAADTDDGQCSPLSPPQSFDCTLREAINAANAHASVGPDVIAFDIPGAGVHTISPTDPLPPITDPVVIDGYTQPGATPNTLASGDNAVLLIELEGSHLGSGGNGLSIRGDSTVRGLVINRFRFGPFGQGVGIVTTGSNNVIAGNFIGTSADGTTALGNGGDGITAEGGGNTIGGPRPADRNLISANKGVGVATGGSNTIQGNLIGTDKTGALGLGNGFDGIFNGGSNSVVRGNVIAFSEAAGVDVVGGTGCVISGNSIFANAGLGIDLRPTGVTPNDAGDAGTTEAIFTVTLSAASAQVVTADFSTQDFTAEAGSDYVAASGTLDFSPGETSRTFSVRVNGDTLPESTEVFLVNLSGPSGATLARAQGFGTITNDDALALLQFSAPDYSAREDSGAATLTVTRTGDTSAAMTVDYATEPGTASDRSDYDAAYGTLRFAPGETQKSFQVLVNRDSLADGTELASVTLSNPTGGAAVGSPGSASLFIDDVAPASPANVIDDTEDFVRQHYHDFLNREPDQAGLQFWTQNIESCGADSQCREAKRVDTSAAFFLSIEFQQTGFLVERTYRAAFGGRPQVGQFLRDTQEVGGGVVVGQPGFETQLEANKRAYFEEFAARPEFAAVYAGLSNAQYVDALAADTGGALSAGARDALVSGLDSSALTRAQALRAVVEDAAFARRESDTAFVLMEYFGYLRRDPDEAGFQFWLQKLESFGGDFRRAEMVEAFLASDEYRRRFGQ